MSRLSLNRVVHGDALAELTALPDGVFGAVVTSPPYNHGASNPQPAGDRRTRRWRGGYREFDDALPTGEYVDYHRRVVAELLRALRPDGLLWYVHRRKSRHDPDGSPALVDAVLAGFPVRAEVIWDKGWPGAGFCAPGPEGGAYYPTPGFESVFLMARDRSALLERGIAAAGDVWHIPRVKDDEHPATFPVELALRCLRATLAGGPVLDPFLGTGTTAQAAVRLGRPFLGIERARAYVDMARLRLFGRERPECPEDHASASQRQLGLI